MKILVECPDLPSNEKPCKYAIREEYKVCLCGHEETLDNRDPSSNNCCQDTSDWFIYIDSLNQLIEILGSCKELKLKFCPWNETVPMAIINK